MNAQLQAEEVEALRAIYDEDFSTVHQEHHTHMVQVRYDHQLSVELLLVFPEDYPSHSPPVYEIRSAPWMDSSDRVCIEQHFMQVYKEASGEVVVYQWIEWLREFLSEKAQAINELHPSEPDPSVPQLLLQEEKEAEVPVDERVVSNCPAIVHGEPLTDRKSTFQAHLAQVTSLEEVRAVLTELKKNRKIATATHNIMAYRIFHQDRSIYQQDCDDDGEAAAGGRLLHLLQIMDVRDAVVVVTRWYGGIHLHADRFKHINNVARTLITDTGIGLQHKVNVSEDRTSKDKKHSKSSSKSKAGKHR